MTIPQATSNDRPAAQPCSTQPPPVRPGAGDIRPPVLARSDASEPAELAPVAVRGYN